METVLALIGGSGFTAIIGYFLRRKELRVKEEDKVSHTILSWANEMRTEIQELKKEVKELRVENIELEKKIIILQAHIDTDKCTVNY